MCLIDSWAGWGIVGQYKQICAGECGSQAMGRQRFVSIGALEIGSYHLASKKTTRFWVAQSATADSSECFFFGSLFSKNRFTSMLVEKRETLARKLTGAVVLCPGLLGCVNVSQQPLVLYAIWPAISKEFFLQTRFNLICFLHACVQCLMLYCFFMSKFVIQDIP